MSRILMVEDDPGNRMVLKSRLADQGYQVTAAESGAQGLMEARAGGFELVLVASGLGSGIDGFEVCRRLKATPETRSTPVVLFTHRASGPEEVDRGYEAGCEAFVTKADQPSLDHVLRILLRLKGSLDQLLEENRALEQKHNKLLQERSRSDGDPSREPIREIGEQMEALRELASGRPDGVLVVDSEGCVKWGDRGACELFGNRIEGQHLGSMAPASGLEAFARDAHTEPRSGFRFDLAARRGHPQRSLTATVVPLVSDPGSEDPGLRIVILGDASRRRLAAELLRVEQIGLPREEAEVLLEAAHESYGLAGLAGASTAAEALRADVARAAADRDPVLLVGEPGSGKGRAARTIHYCSGATGAFLAVRCGSVATETLDRDLFGHVRGAFPEAADDHAGLLTRAQDGTLLLQDFDELEPELQAKVLAFLREGSFQRLGSSKKEKVRVRLLATTARALDGLVAEGRVSTELVDELSRTRIDLPPLREREDDVELLARHLAPRLGALHGVSTISETALWVLARHDWPGNVDELVRCLEQACGRAAGSGVDVDDLPAWLLDRYGKPDRDLIPRPDASSVGFTGVGSAIKSDPMPWDITEEDPVSLDLYEKKALLRAIHETGGDKLAAARLLNVGKSTLYRKLKRFGIQ